MLIDWFTVIAQIVNFLILILLLRKFLYGPILRMMDERQARVTAELRQAEEMKAASEREIQTYQQKHREFDESREKMLENVKAEVDTTRAELLEKARQEVENAQSRWRESLQREKAVFLQDLRQRISRQTYTVTRQALAEMANADLEKQIISVFLERIQNLNQAEVDAFAKSLWQNGQDVVVNSAFELPAETRKRIEKAIHDRLVNNRNIRFELSPDLIGGIEIKTQEHKIAWNLASYFEELEKRLDEAFKVKAYD